MKLEPRAHQKKAHDLTKGRDAYALFCEQGTGKTYMVLADAERLYEQGEITGLLVVSPKGVHTNWANREIPKLLSVDYLCAVYKPKVKYFLRAYDEMMMSSRLRILCINIDAAVTKNGAAVCVDFLKNNRAMMVVDESQRIKNPAAGRTKAITSLGALAAVRRIATGTAATNSPADVFSQFQFLKRGLLGTNSYRAFVAEYTELLPPTHPLVQHIREENPRLRVDPQIAAKDELGNPIYRNLDKLHALMEPHSYRVQKSECLDLPEKIYRTMEFEMSPRHRQVYDALKEDLRIELEEGEITTIKKLALGTKLQQVTSGFMIIHDEPTPIYDKNPRMELFKEIVKDLEGQFIVWAKFTHEIQQIIVELSSMNILCAGYWGEVNDKDREAAVDGFQSGRIRALVGVAKAGGVGLTLTNAEDVIYYSNDFSLEDRMQSEDRCHRDGTTHHVTYTDIVAPNTIDERIAGALATKGNMAAAIMGELDD